MNKVTIFLAAASLCLLSTKVYAATETSPIHQIEVQAVDVAVPEVLLAELRRQSDKTALLNATQKNKILAANSAMAAIADHKALP